MSIITSTCSTTNINIVESKRKNKEIDNLNKDDKKTMYKSLLKKEKIFKKIEKILANAMWLYEQNCASFCMVCSTIIKGSLYHIRKHTISSVHKMKYNAVKNTSKIDIEIKKSSKSLEKKIRESELLIVAFLSDNNVAFAFTNNLFIWIKKPTKK